MRPTGFHHLAVQVRDLARAERFYAGVLGLSVVRRWPWPAEEHLRAGERALWLSLTPPKSVPPPAGGTPAHATGAPGTLPDALLAGGFLALEACDGEVPARPFKDPAPGLHLLALRIDASERAAWEEHLTARGVPVVHRSRWTLYVQDPEGNRIGLSHHPDDP
jgi:catechol 2,3-dioxygenase-like lactoylglutathione lyase family enzyme